MKNSCSIPLSLLEHGLFYKKSRNNLKIEIFFPKFAISPFLLYQKVRTFSDSKNLPLELERNVTALLLQVHKAKEI